MMFKEVVIALVLGATSQVAFAEVVAKVGSKEITLDGFKQKFTEVRRQAVNPPTPEVFLEDLIRYEMGVQEAERLKLADDPAVREKIRQELYKALLEKEIGKKVDGIKVSEAEMRAYYKNNPELRSSHILIEYKADATPEQKNQAKNRAIELLKEVKASKRPFEELVKLYSDDTLSKANGGDIGYQNRVTVVPTYYDAILNAKDGEIIGPIETIYGFHLVKLTGRRTFQEANRRQIRAAVFDEKRKKIFDQYFSKLSGKYPVSKNEKLIKTLK